MKCGYYIIALSTEVWVRNQGNLFHITSETKRAQKEDSSQCPMVYSRRHPLRVARSQSSDYYARVYCEQLDRLKSTLGTKRPASLDRGRVLFHQDHRVITCSETDIAESGGLRLRKNYSFNAYLGYCINRLSPFH